MEMALGFICGGVFGMLLGVIASSTAKPLYREPKIMKPPMWRSGPGANNHEN
jgi:hypothetical protein